MLLDEELSLATEARETGESAETTRTAIEDVGVACLREEEENDDEGEPGEPCELPYSPCPSLRLSGKTPDNRT